VTRAGSREFGGNRHCASRPYAWRASLPMTAGEACRVFGEVPEKLKEYVL
jgi:hypothetical protein